MPKVYTYKTQERRKHADKGHHRCNKCGQDILPGQDRYEWSFRFGGTYRRHVTCGFPRPSELTQSKMAQVYAATEAVEDLVHAEGDLALDDLVQALETAAEEIEQVVSEYNEAAENFGGQGENADRAMELDSYADTIRNAADSLDEDTATLEDMQAAVDQAISECPY